MPITEAPVTDAEAHAYAHAKSQGPGFYPHPTDPRKFFRLVKFDGKDEMDRFDFEVGPGTMYHPELQTAVHPWQMPPGYTPEGYYGLKPAT